MQVHVQDALAGKRPVVEDQAVPTIKAFVVGQLRGNLEQLDEPGGITSSIEVAHLRDVRSRDDLDVGRGLRVDVSKSDGVWPFMNDVARYVAGNYLAEQAIGHE
jgi:hypothetical protein